MNILLSKISNFTLKFHRFILLITLLLIALSVYIVQSLGFRGDFVDLLPYDFPSVRDLDVIKSRAGGEGYLVIVLETPNIEKAKVFAEALVPRISQLKEILYIDYKFDKQFFEERNLLFIDLKDLKTLQTRLKRKIDFERRRANPFYIDLLDEKDDFSIADIKEKYSKATIKDYYITKNQRRLVILAKPSGFANNLEFCRRLLFKTQKIISELKPVSFDPAMKVRYTGRYVVRIEETESMFSDLKRTSVFAIAGIFTLVTLYLRQWLAILFIGIPLFTSLLYSMAFATLTIGYLNMFTTVLIGILTGMGIDFGIHMYLRYLEERQKSKNIGQAIHIMQSSTGRSVFFAAATTVAAFFTLIPTKFIGFSQFGWIAGFGMIICFLNTYFLLPALLIFREKIFPMKQKLSVVSESRNALAGFLAKSPMKSKRYPKPWATVAAFSLFSLFSLWALTKIEFDHDFRKLSSDRYGTLALQEEISVDFSVSLSPTIVYANHQEDIPKLAIRLNQIRDEKGEKSTIKKGLSLYSYVPEQQEIKLPEVRKLGEIASEKTTRFLEGEEAAHIENLKRWAQVTPFTVRDLPPPLIKQYTAVNGHEGSFLFIFPAIDLWHGRDVIRFSDEILEFKEKTKEYDIHVASEALIYSDIFSLVKKEGPRALLAALAAVFLLVWLFVKRLRAVFLVFSPLIFGILSLVGIIRLFGIQFNFMNSIIFPILIGLGIDNGIHIYHRYREAGPGSLRFVLQKTGGAIFLSSATTMIGFGALLIAFHKGLQSIGLLAVIGIGICFLTSVTVLPAILQILENRADRLKSGKKAEKQPDLKTAA